MGILIGCKYPITGVLLVGVVVGLLTIVNRLEAWVERRAIGGGPQAA